jgi:hypothetical protein
MTTFRYTMVLGTLLDSFATLPSIARLMRPATGPAEGSTNMRELLVKLVEWFDGRLAHLYLRLWTRKDPGKYYWHD